MYSEVAKLGERRQGAAVTKCVKDFFFKMAKIFPSADSEPEEQRLEVTDLNLVFLGQNQLVGPKDMH